MHAKNKEFIGLVKASGWSQAEVARQLFITPGAVSQICNGVTRPRTGILNHFRILLDQKNAAAVKSGLSREQTPWAIKLVEALDQLPEKDRQHLLKSFLEMVGAFQAAAGLRKLGC